MSIKQINKREYFMKVLAFAASNSKKSINKKLVTHAVTLLEGVTVEMLDINDYEMPLYSADREEDNGIPTLATQFLEKIAQSDGVVISFAEHNGTYTAAYKNLFDWASRVNPKVFQGKPLIYLSTSPGLGGAKSVLASAVNSAQFFDGDIRGSLSVPAFYDNFDDGKGEIIDRTIKSELSAVMQLLR